MRRGSLSRSFDIAVAAIALGKSAIAIAALLAATLAATLHGGSLPPAQQYLRLAHVVAFTAAGLFLLVGSRSDRRAWVLGIAFTLVATIFADPLVRVHAADATQLDLRERFMALQVDALLPYFTWRFARVFPGPLRDGRGKRIVDGVVRLSFGVGIVMSLANLLLAVDGASLLHAVPGLLLLSRWPRTEIYWPTQFVLTAAGWIVLIARSRQGSVEERRRGRLLIGALLLGTGPSIGWMLLRAASPTFAALLPLRRAGWITYPTLLSTPFTAAYAIVVKKALDVRLVVRMAFRYAMARYSVITLATAPLALLAVTLYASRHLRIDQLAATPGRIALLVFAGLGLTMLRFRDTLLQRVDRRFFREQYDSRRILGDLVERCRRARDDAELAAVLRTEIDRALHLHAVHVLLADASSRAFVPSDTNVRALEASPALIALLRESDGPVDLDLEQPASPASALPERDVNWMLDSGTRMMLPLRQGRRLLGVLALAEKRSELPFTREDRALLSAVAGAAEMAIAYGAVSRRGHRISDDGMSAEAGSERAVECVRCGAVQAAGGGACTRCNGDTIQSSVPHTVAGKFLVDQRLGAGGMGVVYRGADLQLGRYVAIKTLPLLTAREAIRLQREARTVARLSHPNLALIYSAEVWQGQPLLVFEYLAGGTLADRLESGPMPLHAALALGFAMTSALEAIHDSGVLHLDVKPSNIGFTENGVPKLLDFGLAHLMTSIEATRDGDVERAMPMSADVSGFAPRGMSTSLAASRVDGMIRGTPLYMSPEAAAGAAPDPSFDVWGLSMVLYEAIFGRLPFPDRRRAVVSGGVESVASAAISRGSGTPMPSSLVDFFVDALSERKRDRPASARELSERLEVVRHDVAQSLAGAAH